MGVLNFEQALSDFVWKTETELFILGGIDKLSVI